MRGDDGWEWGAVDGSGELLRLGSHGDYIFRYQLELNVIVSSSDAVC